MMRLLPVSASASTEPQPNLILILVDDAGYDDFGFTGCKDWQTPQIDALAGSGVIFSDAYVTASVCGPSRAGLISGRYQQSFGHEENITGGYLEPVPAAELGLPREIPTLGTLLQKKGYVTSAFGKWHLGEAPHFHPNQRGFDHFLGFTGGHRSYRPLGASAHPGHKLMRNREVVRTPTYLTDHLGHEAAAFIRSQTSAPFFLYLAFNAVHSPLDATDADLQAMPIEDKKRRALGAMTAALDRAVGDVIKAVRERGIEENTVIVFTNDNGAATYLKTNNGGLRGRKGTVWEGGLRVPFCMSWPGRIEAGRTVATPVSTLDIGATFCALAGYSDREIHAHALGGENLLRVAAGNTPNRALYWKRGNTSAIRADQWKLILLEDEPRFLFHLGEDRFETQNLIEQAPEKTRDLAGRFTRWEQTLPEPRWQKKAFDRYHKQVLQYWESGE